ncbi:MAG TPA: sigma-70 family RNA polymerase sigma factor [Polyangiaceae bacterium]|nr:sigma-70 family RNA polymerase sigma factor [Polyangiaceae bacterium]
MTNLTLSTPPATGPRSRRLSAPFSPQVIQADRTQRAAQERDLVTRLLRDEAAAWRFFTEHYSRIALASIRRVVSRFNQVTANHDVDEIYARFCLELLSQDKKKLRAFDPEKGSRLSTWIGLLATNASYDYLRFIKRNLVCEPLPERDCLRSGDLSPLEQTETHERASRAAKILHQLSTRDLEFVQLYFAEGLTADEVAARMNINVKTVYTKRHKISARLESLVADQAGT